MSMRGIRFPFLNQITLALLVSVICGCSKPKNDPVQEIFEKQRDLAIQGDAEAQFLVGGMLARGSGTDQDFAEAMRWCRLASDQGHKHAPCVIGGLYEDGNGVEQNSAEAEKWYVLSADRGSEEGMRALGNMYMTGNGVEVDHAKAANWFTKAAEKLDWRSQARLAAMYEDGLGVEQNFVQAYAWMFTANHYSGNGKDSELEQIRAKMTAEQIDEAQKLAAEFVERHGDS